MFDIKRVTHKVVATIPTFMRQANRYVPPWIQTQVLCLGLNRFFQQELAKGELDFMCNKTLVIDVSDYQLLFAITLQQRRLKIRLTPVTQDLLISVNSADMLAMINNQVDPDTLFFRRRLLMLGDTELGLQCKNLLDSIGIERLPVPLAKVLDWLVAQQQSLSAV
jgi:O2-independent ubiquinone biosynthesis accessory factor UbiT